MYDEIQMSQNAEADHNIRGQLISEKHYCVCRKEYFISSLDGILASFSVAVIKHQGKTNLKENRFTLSYS